MIAKKEDAALALARYVTTTRIEDIPAQATEAVKKLFLDTLGVILAGSTAPGIKEAREVVVDWGGKEESTIIAFGDKLPSLFAAYINGTMAHARDYDDYHEISDVHSGVTVIPTALAMAERKGKVTGKVLIEAVALGLEVGCRLGTAAGLNPGTSGWHNTTIFGLFASTAVAGKLLGLDFGKMVNAFGIAYSQAGGNAQPIVDSALVKRMQPGFAAKNAILSSLLAEKGYTGVRDTFEGKYGLFPQYYHGKYNQAALTADLGKSYESSNFHFKPYPSCGLTHTGIDAAIALAKENDINPREIEKIIAYHGANTGHLCTEPRAVRQRPKQVVDAQFSVQYTIARGLMQRKIGLSDFTPESVVSEEAAKIAEKVETRYMAELNPPQGTTEAAIVEVHLTGGRVYSKRADIAKGDPRNPMNWKELADKFRDCATYSVKPISKANIEKVIQLTSKLEKVDDVSRIVQLVS